MCDMRRGFAGVFCAWIVIGAYAAVFARKQAVQAQSAPAMPTMQAELRTQRTSDTDLEIGGKLGGAPADETRYLTRKALLALPQVAFTVTDDSNFKGPTKLQGVALAELARDLGAPGANFVVAICSDKYQANYPHEYIARHKPLLVLEVDGKAPAEWPKDPFHHTFMGPYVISQPKFTPGPNILSAKEQAQIPWGVVRLDFRDEKAVYGPIEPRGPQASDAAVQAGYRIARENCYRCHNMGSEGGQKSGLSWPILAAFATGATAKFEAYVRDPAAQNPKTQMPGQDYDEATMQALVAYYATFAHPAHAGVKP
jgi:mono/diheme cytochrome c family protein